MKVEFRGPFLRLTKSAVIFKTTFRVPKKNCWLSGMCGIDFLVVAGGRLGASACIWRSG